jgi:hypothetical protein
MLVLLAGVGLVDFPDNFSGNAFYRDCLNDEARVTGLRRWPNQA